MVSRLVTFQSQKSSKSLKKNVLRKKTRPAYLDKYDLQKRVPKIF